MTDVLVSTIRIDCNTTTGNQTIYANLGGLTPKAVFFIVTRATVDGTPSAHAVVGHGAATGASNRWAMGYGIENGVNPTDSNRRGTKDECVLILNQDGTAIDGEADFVSFGPNSCTINWGNAPASRYLLTAVFYAGAELSAQAGSFAAPAVVNTTLGVSTGFTTDVVLLATPCYVMDDLSHASAWYSYGVAVNKTPVQQYSYMLYDGDGIAPSSVAGRISTQYGTGQITSAGAILWGGEIAFITNGFSCTSRIGGSGGDEVGYLALGFNNKVSYDAGILDTRTSTGNQSITAPGFRPQFVMCGLTQLTAIDTSTTTGDAGSFGVSVFDSDVEYCNSEQHEDNSTPSDTQTLSDNQAINFPNDDGSTGHVGTFVSFDIEGWTWNYSSTEGTAVKWWWLAIGESTPTISVLTVPSTIQSSAFSVLIYKPTISSYTPNGTLVDTIANITESLSFTSVAVGGYWQSRLSIKDRQVDVESWLDRLGYHIEIYSPSLVKVWEGFINSIKIDVSAFSVVRGPFKQIANRIYLVYSTVDTTTTPPVMGIRATDGPNDDTSSQGKYGIIEKVISAGGVSISEVSDVVTTYLNEYKEPETSKGLTTSSAVELSVSIECLGYVHWLDLFTSTDTTSGTRTIPQKIQDILGDDPNGLFSTDYSEIDPDGLNSQTVTRYQNDLKTAWSQIKGLVARGDGTDRWTFGIYNDRKAYYNIVPSDYKYQQYLSDPSQKFTSRNGTVIKPWELEPAQWIFFPDFLIGKTVPDTLREDPRMLFIESYTYQMPWAVSLDGGKVSTLSQKLAGLGLAGVG